jgi:preprotein translocase subunit SecE
MKQGEENTKFVKDPENETDKFIFQKNTKTKTAAAIIIGFLAIIIIALAISGHQF